MGGCGGDDPAAVGGGHPPGDGLLVHRGDQDLAGLIGPRMGGCGPRPRRACSSSSHRPPYGGLRAQNPITDLQTWAMGLVDPSAMTGAREHPPNGGLRAAASCRMRRSGTGSRSVGSPMRSRSATGVRASATTAASPGAPATGAAHALKTLNRTTAPSTPQPAGRRRLHRTGCLNGRLWGSRPATDTDPGSRSASPHPAVAQSPRSSHHRRRGS